MSSILVSSGMDVDSFCNPSRGPTSTIRTSPAFRRKLVEKLRPAHQNLNRLARLVRGLVWGMINAYNWERGQRDALLGSRPVDRCSCGENQVAISRSLPGDQESHNDV